MPNQATVVAGVAVVLLLVDLRVTTFEATAADEGNAAYPRSATGLPDACSRCRSSGRDPLRGAYMYYGT